MAKNVYPIVFSMNMDSMACDSFTAINQLGNHHITTAMTEGVQLNNSGSSAFRRGDYDTAIGLFQKAIDIKVKAYGEESLHVCISLSGLSDSYFKKGDISKAKKECERMLRIATCINNTEQMRIAREIAKDISELENSQ
jgi:hypothetical protein